MTTDADILIIGAGPVGLYAAYYAGFREPSTVVMDSLLGQAADKLERQPDGRLLVTSTSNERVRCRAVVISGGIGTFMPRPLPAGAEYEGRGVTYFVPHPDEHAGKDVVVVGGGDSAVDWALALHPIASSVTLVHRRDAFRAHQHSARRMREAGVEVLTPYTVSGVHGDGVVERVDISHFRTKQVRSLPCQSVVAALRFTADLGTLESWGLDIRDRRILVNSQMQTNLPMVYAAGDIADYQGKVRLISVGFGEAATAVNNAAVAINPALDLFPGHSTDTAA
jgi:thioredoxin reductase (NADPH)